MGKSSTRLKFGKIVRSLRLKRGLTQTELAKRARISIRHLQKIESQNPPDITLDTISKIADGFKISCFEIFKS